MYSQWRSLSKDVAASRRRTRGAGEHSQWQSLWTDVAASRRRTGGAGEHSQWRSLWTDNAAFFRGEAAEEFQALSRCGPYLPAASPLKAHSSRDQRLRHWLCSFAPPVRMTTILIFVKLARMRPCPRSRSSEPRLLFQPENVKAGARPPFRTANVVGA